LQVGVPYTSDGGVTWGLRQNDFGAADPSSAEPERPSPLPDDSARPAQHSFFWTGRIPSIFRTQDWLEREFHGLEYRIEIPNPGVTGSPDPIVYTLFSPEKDAIAPFPIVTADLGVNSVTGGTLAFPTTGSLLLVTRCGWLPEVGGGVTPARPVTVAATESVSVGDPSGSGMAVPLRSEILQMQQLDNGHMPIFDWEQNCKDRSDKEGRPDVPWGQLVFDYFTALPLEELVRPIDFSSMPPPLDALGIQSLVYMTDEEYETAYQALFLGYPVVERVSTGSSVPFTFGPRVRGRINVNLGPWWVLDGLPVLPDVPPALGTGSLSALPVPELLSEQMDDPAHQPTGTDNQPAGWLFVDGLVDQLAGTPPPPLGLPSISPEMARSMVAYRERRTVDGVTLASDQPNDGVGFVSVGALCDAMTRMRVTVKTQETTTGTNPSGPATKAGTLGALRDYSYRATDASDPNTTVKPFAYLGYLQLVAPVVRLQDWATVKNHVFTVYATVRSTSDPRIDLRTQVTVDRTRCLYNPNELPVRIAETDPIGYYNAMED